MYATISIVLAVVSCAPYERQAEVTFDDAYVLEQAVKSDAKVRICHAAGGSGNWVLLEIAQSAVYPHLTLHGDHVFSAEDCSDGIDNDCDGLIDEDDTACSDDGFVGTWAAELTCSGGDADFEFDAVALGSDEYLADDASAMFALYNDGGVAFGYNVSGTENGGCIGSMTSSDVFTFDICNGSQGDCTGTLTRQD